MQLKRRPLLVTTALLLAFGGTWAQSDYPQRPIKIVVPVAAGAAADTLMRRLGDHVGKALGQPVVIENKPGAQGAIASRAVAKAPNDGYTLLLGGNSSHAANVYMLKDPGYDPVKDFTPIVQLTVNPQLLVVNADVPVRTVQEFVKYAKEHPGKLSYGTGNSGSVVAAQLLKTQSGIEAVGVNYAGMAQVATDLIAGRVEFSMIDPVVVGPFVQSGKLRILGVTSKQRLAALPNVAPLAESGQPAYDYAGWIGLFGPAGMAPDITRRLNQAFLKALADPANDRFIAEGGMISAGSTPENLQTYLQEQIKSWGHWTKDAGMTPS